ncbi:MAG: PQQ-binding-like beta-propeller repeat protein [Planctomycetales bacterium]
MPTVVLRCLSCLTIAGCVAWLAVELPAADPHWPRWRGPRGDGHVTHAELPVEWDADSVQWKVSLKGSGQSTPVVWENRIFLTSAEEEGQKRHVLCLDRQTGDVLWEHEAWTGEPEPIHKMNSWASASCATDGAVVAAFFGRGGLHAYTVEGKHLWSNDLGPFESPWGTGACPVFFENLIIQNCDADADACIRAFDKQTGAQVWTTPRPNFRGWSTPILIQVADQWELVVNGHAGVTAYNPLTGETLWFCKSFNGRGEPTITPAGELLCAVCGLSGDMYAIRPGGRGDVTETHRVWHTPRNSGRDLPSPIAIGEYLLVVDLKGIGTCYEAATGNELWKERLCNQISSSPIAAGGLAYFLDESGLTVVVKPGPQLEIVASNPLPADAEDVFRASLTPVPEGLLARSQRVLYFISGSKPTSSQPQEQP